MYIINYLFHHILWAFSCFEGFKHFTTSFFFCAQQSDFDVGVDQKNLEMSHKIAASTLVVERVHEFCVGQDVVFDAVCYTSDEVDAAVGESLQSKISCFISKVLSKLFNDLHAKWVLIFHSHINNVF